MLVTQKSEALKLCYNSQLHYIQIRPKKHTANAQLRKQY